MKYALIFDKLVDSEIENSHTEIALITFNLHCPLVSFTKIIRN